MFNFYKGFNKSSNTASNKPLKSNFGPRSVDDIIKDRYRNNSISQVQNNNQNNNQNNFKPNDYQLNIRGQQNLRNLDK